MAKTEKKTDTPSITSYRHNGQFYWLMILEYYGRSLNLRQQLRNYITLRCIQNIPTIVAITSFILILIIIDCVSRCKYSGKCPQT
jgi:hypothetical protein